MEMFHSLVESGVCVSRDKMAAPQTSLRTSHMGMSKPQENSDFRSPNPILQLEER